MQLIVQLIDAGLVLYIGLFALFIWRLCCGWRCCGKWLQYANYCSLLLGLVFMILAYESWMFFSSAQSVMGQRAWSGFPVWLKPMILAGPFINAGTFLACTWQVFNHVERIREESAVHRHDRAVQIILLPAVYSAMAMSSLTRSYTFICSAADPYASAAGGASQQAIEAQALVISQSEAYFYVGDLYEAWALYQFGKLVLELIESELSKQAETSNTPESRGAGLALQTSHKAVASLAWLGIWSFLLVCVAQAGWSLWLLTFQCHTPDSGSKFDESMAQFTVAGFLSSCAAIYNVYVVEREFDEYLPDFFPFLKFLTVKIIVAIAFFQRLFFKSLPNIDRFMPEFLQNITKAIPFLGDIVHFSPVPFELFYASLIIVECFLICLAHQWAWNSEEAWYEEVGNRADEDIEAEKMALMGQATDAAYGAPRYSM